MKTTIRSPHLPLIALAAIATAIFIPTTAHAETFTWADTTAGGDWGNAANWYIGPAANKTPSTVVPGSLGNTDANVTISIPNSGGEMSFPTGEHTFSVNNLSLTAKGGTTLQFYSNSNTPSPQALNININGTLSKNNGSANVSFQEGPKIALTNARPLNLTIGTLNFAQTSGYGTYNFGSVGNPDYNSDTTRYLSTLSIGTINMGSSSPSPSTINLTIRAESYSLGTINFSNSNTKTINLINYVPDKDGLTRTANVTGINSTAGSTAATIRASTRVSLSANTATLAINTAANTEFSANTILEDGTGGTLALLKTGAGKQTLTGALTHTGGTTVEQGTLVITGSLAATGNLTIAKNATLIAGAALTQKNAAFESGAILGIDLGANAKLNLTGNLTQKGTGTPTFVIDFLNTGVTGQTYSNLLSVTGTNDFAGATLTYINFGTEGLTGTLSLTDLTNNLIISASTPIPEPSVWTAIIGTLALLGAGAYRQLRQRH